MFLYLVKHSPLFDKIINHLQESINRGRGMSAEQRDYTKIIKYENYVDILRFWKNSDTIRDERETYFNNSDSDIQTHVIKPVTAINDVFIPILNGVLTFIFQIGIVSYYSNSHLNNGVEEYYEPHYHIIFKKINFFYYFIYI